MYVVEEVWRVERVIKLSSSGLMENWYWLRGNSGGI
jgi:hypothetical protein